MNDIKVITDPEEGGPSWAYQVPVCQPGLEELIHIDELVVHHQMELVEVSSGWETEKSIKVKNRTGQELYIAYEDSGMCNAQLCGVNRAFVIQITDNINQEVIRVIRKSKCGAGCCWCTSINCCGFEVKVESPIGTVVGYVRQLRSLWKPHYTILDATREKVLSISGPCSLKHYLCTKGNNDFKIFGLDTGSSVGRISKRCDVLPGEKSTDADMFGITFPIDLDVKVKATLLGASFLIDMMFFEQQSNMNVDTND